MILKKDEVQMLKIFKYETEYFKLLIIVIAVLPLIFTVFAMNDFLLFQQVYFLKKYFWSVVVGLGIYAFVFMIWSLRKKELRDRKHILLPVSLKKIAFSRWIFGVAPFILTFFYLEIIRFCLPEQQIIFVERISGQLGLLFIFLAALDLLINASFAINQNSILKQKIFLAGILLMLLISTIIVSNLVSDSGIKPFPNGGEELFFFIWGLIISIIDVFVFAKRKSFLR